MQITGGHPNNSVVIQINHEQLYLNNREVISKEHYVTAYCLILRETEFTFEIYCVYIQHLKY